MWVIVANHLSAELDRINTESKGEVRPQTLWWLPCTTFQLSNVRVELYADRICELPL